MKDENLKTNYDASLLQAFIEISEKNLFPTQFGDGTILLSMTPNDIYQLGYGAAFNECFNALKTSEPYDLQQTRQALKRLYDAVRRSQSVNDPIGMTAAMDEAGRWF